MISKMEANLEYHILLVVDKDEAVALLNTKENSSQDIGSTIKLLLSKT